MGFLNDLFGGGNNGNNSVNDFFSGLVNGFNNTAGDMNQQISFANYLNSLNQTGQLDAMSQLEKNKVIIDALNKCGAAATPNTSLGQIYPLVSKMLSDSSYNLSQPTAHETCPRECAKSREKCEGCLKQRLAVLEALYYVDRPDEYKSRVAAPPPRKRSGKCSLCGALVEPSMKICSYCDTPVNDACDEAGSIFLSAAKLGTPEQAAYDLIYQYTVEDVDERYSEENKKIALTVSLALVAPQRLQLGAYFNQAAVAANFNAAIDRTRNHEKVKMSMSDIFTMANEYHLSVSQYLRCLFDGDPNIHNFAIDQDLKQDQQKREAEQRQREANRQAQLERQERQRKANAEFWERRRASYTPPQYNGGGGGGTGSERYCCGKCAHYMAAGNECAVHSWRPKSAGDYCSDFKSR